MHFLLQLHIKVFNWQKVKQVNFYYKVVVTGNVFFSGINAGFYRLSKMCLENKAGHFWIFLTAYQLEICQGVMEQEGAAVMKSCR